MINIINNDWSLQIGGVINFYLLDRWANRRAAQWALQMF